MNLNFKRYTAKRTKHVIIYMGILSVPFVLLTIFVSKFWGIIAFYPLFCIYEAWCVRNDYLIISPFSIEARLSTLYLRHRHIKYSWNDCFSLVENHTQFPYLLVTDKSGRKIVKYRHLHIWYTHHEQVVYEMKKELERIVSKRNKNLTVRTGYTRRLLLGK